MAQWAGLGERIRERLLALGYEKHGRADILRFCLEHRLVAANVYRWVNANVMPERDNVLHLAELLKVSPAWLLFGDEAEVAQKTGDRPKRRVPISGGSDHPAPLPGGDHDNALSLIGRWLRDLARPMLPRPWSYA